MVPVFTLLLVLVSFSVCSDQLPPAPSGFYESLEDARLVADTGQAVIREPMWSARQKDIPVSPPLEFSAWRWGVPTMQSLDNGGGTP